MKKMINFILKKIKLRTLIVLAVLLMFNTYAWFIYSTRVRGSLTAHIVSWDLEFIAGEEEITTNIAFDVDRIYPGMDTYTKTVTANNKGEMAAKLTYEILSVTILGETTQKGEIIDLEEVDSDYLEDMIKNNYPFCIEIVISNEDLIAGSGTGDFVISLTWPFESNNDEWDTEWGEKAYEFYSLNPGEISIHIELEITAMQKLP